VRLPNYASALSGAGLGQGRGADRQRRAGEILGKIKLNSKSKYCMEILCYDTIKFGQLTLFDSQQGLWGGKLTSRGYLERIQENFDGFF
jgi:hypothetical protein